MIGVDTNEKLMEMIAGYAGRAIEIAGECLPTFFGVPTAGRLMIIAAPWSSASEQDAALEVVRGKFAEAGVVRYGFISEAWQAAFAPGAKRVLPVEAPNRVEVLVHGVVDRDGATLHRIRNIVRTPGVALPSLGDPQDIANAIGRLFSLLKPEHSNDAAGRYH